MREANIKVRQTFIKLLNEKGLKMKFVADKLGLEYTTMSKWKNGHFDYGHDTLQKIANYLQKQL